MGVSGAQDGRNGAAPRRLVVILLMVIPLSQIPLDVYTPALPQMVIDLHGLAMGLFSRNLGLVGGTSALCLSAHRRRWAGCT